MIPSPRTKPWWKSRWSTFVASVLAVLTALVTVLVELWLLSLLPRGQAPVQNVPWKLLLPTFTLCSVGFKAWLDWSKAYEEDRIERDQYCPENLRGCLHVIYRTIAGAKAIGSPDEGWLRVTLYKLDKQELEQVVRYVGGDENDEDKGPGRRFSIYTGLIGRVARSGGTDPRVFDRGDMSLEDWRRFLVEECGMTAKQAERVRSDRHSFCIAPICGEDHVLRGLVYLDSRIPGFFDRKVMFLVASGCVGLAKWIDEHYYRRKGKR